VVILSFCLCLTADLLPASNAVSMQSRFWGSGEFVSFERNIFPLRMARGTVQCAYIEKYSDLKIIGTRHT